MNKSQLFTELWNNKTAAQVRQNTLAKRYNRAWAFYRGTAPEVMRKGDLPASRVMWKAFESIYPSLVALFTDSEKAPVSFDSDETGNIDIAKAITKAVHTAALKVNNAYTVYMKAIKEMLITGNQAALVGYETKTYETDKHKFDGADVRELMTATEAIKLAGYNVVSDITLDEDTQTVTGWVQGTREIKYPVINLIDFKDFLLHPEAETVEDSNYTGYAEKITIGQAAERGYDLKALRKGEKDNTAEGRGIDKTLLVIDDMNGDDVTGQDSVISDYNNTITIWHHYWRGYYNSKKQNMYYCVTTDVQIVHMEKVAYCPLVLGGMSVANGSAWSESLYDICQSAQTSKTRAMRAIQRAADNAAYGEYVGVESLLTAKGKASLANRGAGAFYEVKGVGAISKLQVTDIPNAMQLLNNEISQDAKDTIQGSAGQAQALEENGQASGVAVALTQDKQELNENQIAKTIAETFIKPMYRILLLVLQEMGNNLDVNGIALPLKAIRSDLGLSIDVETAYDRANAAANVLNALNTGTQAGTIPANITDENKYNIFADYMRAATGQQDVSNYITAPEDMPKPSKAQQLIQAVLTVAQLRSQIAATELAEGKVNDQKADTQKKYNEAAKDLAEIKQILSEIDTDKMRLILDAQKQRDDENSDLTKNAQSQESLDNAA